MRHLIKLFLAIGILSMLGYGCSGKSKTDEELKTIAETYDSHCPMKVSDDTRLDSVYTLPGKNFVYRYTLELMNPSSFDKTAFEADRKGYIAHGIRTSEEMSYLRSLGVTFIYEYFDQNGKSLTHITIQPEDYR